MYLKKTRPKWESKTKTRPKQDQNKTKTRLKILAKSKKHRFLKNNKFLSEPYCKVVKTAEEIFEEIERIDKIKTELGILIDGMVIKLNQVEVVLFVAFTLPLIDLQ